jgi:hypothetical protein
MLRRVLALSSIAAASMLATPWAGAVRAASPEDQALVARVAQRIIAEVDPPAGWSWPPLVYIVNFEGGSFDDDMDGEIDGGEINAKASMAYVKPGGEPQWPEGTSVTRIPVPGPAIVGDADEEGMVLQPVIRIYQGWLTIIVEGRDERLANTFGHELQHILLGHVTTPVRGTPLVEYAVTRDQEAEADIEGFKLALDADYAYDDLMESLIFEREHLPLSTTFKAYSETHPGYTDRVALVEKNKTDIWRALSAFENGVVFLATEQYDLAAAAFKEVVARAPECYEGWANLGYAELMLYYEGLGRDTLREYDIGQLALGGYYSHAASLGIRGADRRHWDNAVDALQHALTLNQDLIVARANLAAAYMVHPAGKDVGAAAREFAPVIAALEAGKVEEDVDARTRAALLVNASVIELADGDGTAAAGLLAKARELFQSPAEFESTGVVAGAAHYNQALLLARSGEPAGRQSAIDEYAAYLNGASSSLAWWDLAYDAYEKLCREQGVEPVTRATLADAAKLQRRMVTGIRLANGDRLTITEPMEQVEAALGPGVRTNFSRIAAVHRRRYLAEGLDILCNNRVLAIRLMGKKAPPLLLAASGAGPGNAAEVRIGMTFDDVLALMGDDAKRWDRRYGTTFMVEYRYFWRLGFGVRLTADKRVTEIIVAQIPDAAIVETKG